VEETNESDPMTERVRGLGGALLDDDALSELLQRVVVLARNTVRGAVSVSITVADGGGFRTSNSTDRVALAVDEAQYAGDGGPCLHAVRTERQVQVAVGTSDVHWPLFEEKAREEGIAAVLSTPLVRTPGDGIGALNVYGRDGGGFGEDAQQTATIIGEHAAILVGIALDLLNAAQLNEQLRQALASREIIGEAKGIIMERQSCTRDEAFDILRRASQRENRKLRDMAEDLVLRVEARKGGRD